MKKFNIVRPKKYTKNNEEKTAWLPIGIITEFDNGNQILELNNSSETFQIFPLEKKATNNVEKAVESADNIRTENIPF